MNAKDVAKAIEFPVEAWPGKCYGVAGEILKAGLVEGAELHYGHWLGPVSESCPVEGFKNGAPFQRHGWIEREDGSIVDPTRWVFEGAEPYIYEGPNDYYDVGGNVYREASLRPCPDYDPTEERTTLAVWKFDGDAHRYVMDEIFDHAPGITAPMAWWLANLPLQRLDVHARPIYLALVDCGLRARIPIDNYRLVLGDPQ